MSPHGDATVTIPLRFAINRISAPNMPYAEFAAMSQRLGVGAVEIRYDLKGGELTDGTPAKQVADATAGHGLTLRSINALQRFEQFDATREAEAVALSKYAVASGTEALVLCPTNTPVTRAARSSATPTSSTR